MFGTSLITSISSAEIKHIEITQDWSAADEEQLMQWNLQIAELKKELEKEDEIASKDIDDINKSMDIERQIWELEEEITKITCPKEAVISSLLSKKLPRNMFGHIDSHINKIKNKTIINITSMEDTSHKIRLNDFFASSGIPIDITTKVDNDIIDILSFSNHRYKDLVSWLKNPSTQFIKKFYPPLKFWGMLPTLIKKDVEDDQSNLREDDSKEHKDNLFALTHSEHQIIALFSEKIKDLETQYNKLVDQTSSFLSKNDRPRARLQQQITQIQKAKKNLELPEDKEMTKSLNALFPQFHDTSITVNIARKEKKILISFFPCEDLEGIKKVFDAFCSDVTIKYKNHKSLHNKGVSLKINLNQREQLLHGISLIPSSEVAFIDAPSMAKC